MKIKTEAAAVITFRIEELKLIVAQSRASREFGIAQRIEQIIEKLEEAREFVLAGGAAQETDQSEDYVMPEALLDFMRTAPVGSKIRFVTVPSLYYVKRGSDSWARSQEDGTETEAFWTVADFSEGENEGFTREVGRG